MKAAGQFSFESPCRDRCRQHRVDDVVHLFFDLGLRPQGLLVGARPPQSKAHAPRQNARSSSPDRKRKTGAQAYARLPVDDRVSDSRTMKPPPTEHQARARSMISSPAKAVKASVLGWMRRRRWVPVEHDVVSRETDQPPASQTVVAAASRYLRHDPHRPSIRDRRFRGVCPDKPEQHSLVGSVSSCRSRPASRTDRLLTRVTRSRCLRGPATALRK